MIWRVFIFFIYTISVSIHLLFFLALYHLLFHLLRLLERMKLLTCQEEVYSRKPLATIPIKANNHIPVIPVVHLTLDIHLVLLLVLVQEVKTHRRPIDSSITIHSPRVTHLLEVLCSVVAKVDSIWEGTWIHRRLLHLHPCVGLLSPAEVVLWSPTTSHRSHRHPPHLPYLHFPPLRALWLTPNWLHLRLQTRWPVVLFQTLPCSAFSISRTLLPVIQTLHPIGNSEVSRNRHMLYKPTPDQMSVCKPVLFILYKRFVFTTLVLTEFLPSIPTHLIMFKTLPFRSKLTIFSPC